MNKKINFGTLLLVLSGSVYAYPPMSPFEMADKNGDGKLSHEEYIAFTGQSYELKLRVDHHALDRNMDKVVTANEFTQYAPFAEKNASFFNENSSDGKTLSFDEFKKMRQIDVNANTTSLLWEFAAKDLNSDKVLSMSEFHNMPQPPVETLDTNGNGIPDHLEHTDGTGTKPSTETLDVNGNGILDHLETNNTTK